MTSCIMCYRTSSVFWWPVDFWGNQGSLCDICMKNLIEMVRMTRECQDFLMVPVKKMVPIKKKEEE